MGTRYLDMICMNRRRDIAAYERIASWVNNIFRCESSIRIMPYHSILSRVLRTNLPTGNSGAGNQDNIERCMRSL